MAGKRSPQSPSISQLTSPRNRIVSRCWRLRHSGFQPHPGRHPGDIQSSQITRRTLARPTPFSMPRELLKGERSSHRGLRFRQPRSIGIPFIRPNDKDRNSA
jgi:hypothetical protein